MIKKTITYELFDGEKVTEDFWFNLTKTEIIEWKYSVNGGIDKLLENVINTRDQKSMISLVGELISRSYGEKSIDGKKFVKVVDGHKLFEDFRQTNAYDVLFMELSQNVDKAQEFLKGVIPPDVAESFTEKVNQSEGPAALLNASKA